VFTWTSNGTNGASVYVNTVETQYTGMPTPISFNGYWRIGEGDGSNDYFIPATIGRVAFYPSALSTTQVNNHYDAMLTGGTSAYDTLMGDDGATHYWHLSEATGTTAADSAGTDTGTYTGGYNLAEAFTIGGASGSPAIAWLSPPLQVTTAQFLTPNIPLGATSAAGGMEVSTTTSGSGGGVVAGFTIPGIPIGIAFE
jgi:hypothetical protein